MYNIYYLMRQKVNKHWETQNPRMDFEINFIKTNLKNIFLNDFLQSFYFEICCI